MKISREKIETNAINFDRNSAPLGMMKTFNKKKVEKEFKPPSQRSNSSKLVEGCSWLKGDFISSIITGASEFIDGKNDVEGTIY